MGLGLAIVRHLVELHGGIVYASSLGEGQGATFTVTLPLLEDSQDIMDKGKDSLLLTPHSSPLADLRLLVVDDEVDTLEFLAFFLEQNGAEVRAVPSAQEALEVFAQRQPDLLLTDIGMPDVDGYMLIRQIRAMPSQKGLIPAIALTAFAGETDHQQVLQAGFQKHLTKPVDLAELVAAITKLVGRTKN